MSSRLKPANLLSEMYLLLQVFSLPFGRFLLDFVQFGLHCCSGRLTIHGRCAVLLSHPQLDPLGVLFFAPKVNGR